MSRDIGEKRGGRSVYYLLVVWVVTAKPGKDGG